MVGCCIKGIFRVYNIFYFIFAKFYELIKFYNVDMMAFSWSRTKKLIRNTYSMHLLMRYGVKNCREYVRVRPYAR